MQVENNYNSQDNEIWHLFRQAGWQLEIWDAPWPHGPFDRAPGEGVAVLIQDGLVVALLSSAKSKWSDSQIDQAASMIGAPIIIREFEDLYSIYNQNRSFNAYMRFSGMRNVFNIVPTFQDILGVFQNLLIEGLTPNLCQGVSQALGRWNAGPGTRIPCPHRSAVDSYAADHAAICPNGPIARVALLGACLEGILLDVGLHAGYATPHRPHARGTWRKFANLIAEAEHRGHISAGTAAGTPTDIRAFRNAIHPNRYLRNPITTAMANTSATAFIRALAELGVHF